MSDKNLHARVPPKIEDCRLGGQIQGQRNVETGWLDTIRPKAVHQRWCTRIGPRAGCTICFPPSLKN